ncbi:hypothetical protein [Streptomyces hirsutus]
MDNADRERAFARCSQRWATGTNWRRYAATWDRKPSVWQRLTTHLRFAR